MMGLVPARLAVNGLRASLLTLAFLALTGCAYKYYEGPELSRSDTAEIWTIAFNRRSMGNSMRVTAINSVQLRRYAGKLDPDVVLVLPGKYEVKLTALKTVREIVFVVTVGFEAKPGYSYFFTTTGSLNVSGPPETTVCAYEELQDDFKARRDWKGDYTGPGENARKLACSPVGLQRQ
jgi:hypothetical protein